MELTRGALLREAVARLKAAGVETASLDARLLLQDVLRVEATTLRAAPEAPISDEETSRFRDFLDRRVSGESVGRILGRREFWSLEFELSPETLEPRPDSETVVEAALAVWGDRPPPARLLDLGTGTGCLLLALLSEWKTSFGLGVDRSFGAAATAQRNAASLGLADRAAFVNGDWASALRGTFEMIVSNPPYIETETIAALGKTVRDFDPLLALDGGPSGLEAYRRLVPQTVSLLTPGGWLLLEIGADQAGAVTLLLAQAGLRAPSVRNDLAGRPRCVLAQKPH